MKAKWIILAMAGAVVVLAWTAVGIAYFFFREDLTFASWTALVTVAAFALEGFFWVGAGVLGWSFLAGRRAAIERLRQRFFGRRE